MESDHLEMKVEKTLDEIAPKVEEPFYETDHKSWWDSCISKVEEPLYEIDHKL